MLTGYVLMRITVPKSQMPKTSARAVPAQVMPGLNAQMTMTALTHGKAQVQMQGSSVAILAFGAPLHDCIDIAGSIDATLVNMRFVKPLDAELICSLAASHELLVTVEENAVSGGAGSGVNELLMAAGIACNVLNIGIPDRFIEHGARDDCLADAGLDKRSIARQIHERMQAMGLAIGVKTGVARGGS